MSLVLLIVILVIAYIGWNYLKTFQQMVDELRQMRTQCIKSGVPLSTTETNELKIQDKLVGVLDKMKTFASK